MHGGLARPSQRPRATPSFVIRGCPGQARARRGPHVLNEGRKASRACQGTIFSRSHRSSRTQRIGTLRDGNDLELVIACACDIPDGFPHQELCHRGHERDRSGLRVRFVLPDDAIGLHPPVIAPERSPCCRTPQYPSTSDQRSPEPSKPAPPKYSHIAQRPGLLPASFIDIVDRLRRRAGRAAPVRADPTSACNPAAVTRLGMRRNRPIGEHRFRRRLGTVSLVKATLTAGTPFEFRAVRQL